MSHVENVVVEAGQEKAEKWRRERRLEQVLGSAVNNGLMSKPSSFIL